jgi:hypothetical protein
LSIIEVIPERFGWLVPPSHDFIPCQAVLESLCQACQIPLAYGSSWDAHHTLYGSSWDAHNTGFELNSVGRMHTPTHARWDDRLHCLLSLRQHDIQPTNRSPIATAVVQLTLEPLFRPVRNIGTSRLTLLNTAHER